MDVTGNGLGEEDFPDGGVEYLTENSYSGNKSRLATKKYCYIEEWAAAPWNLTEELISSRQYGCVAKLCFRPHIAI